MHMNILLLMNQLLDGIVIFASKNFLFIYTNYNFHLTFNLLINFPNNSNNYADSSTSTLWRHIQGKHPELLGEGKQKQDNQDQEVQKKEKVFIISFNCKY